MVVSRSLRPLSPFNSGDHSYTIQSCDTQRFASYAFKAPTYYIQVSDDINANVSFHQGTNGDDSAPRQ